MRTDFGGVSAISGCARALAGTTAPEDRGGASRPPAQLPPYGIEHGEGMHQSMGVYVGIVERTVPGTGSACTPVGARMAGPGTGTPAPGTVPGTSPSLGQDSDMPAAAARGTADTLLHAGDAVLPGETRTKSGGGVAMENCKAPGSRSAWSAPVAGIAPGAV